MAPLNYVIYGSHEGTVYDVLAYTSQVNRVFCTIWLVSLSQNILHYSPLNKTRWRPVVFMLRKNFFNKRSRRARQYQISNEIWHESIQRYVFLLVFSDKCTKDLFENVLFTDEWATSRRSIKLF